MLLLNGGGLPTLLRCRQQFTPFGANLGRLARPRHIGKLCETLDAGFKVGIDNDAFSGWSLHRYVVQLGRIVTPCCSCAKPRSSTASGGNGMPGGISVIGYVMR